MDQKQFERIDANLEDEQRRLLCWMVESERAIPTEQHGSFWILELSGDAFLFHRHILQRPPVRKGDLRTLAENSLLRRTYDDGSQGYELTPRGRNYYSELKRQDGAPVERITREVRNYLETEAFQINFARAYEFWRTAEDDLWGADSEGSLTKIGHACREAMQAFAAQAVEHVGVTDVGTDPAKTIARIRTALDYQEKTGVRRDFLDALLAYWGTVNDLVQRQEHGAGKEGEHLMWEDARRIVFHTMIVMSEVARGFSRLRPMTCP